MGDARDLPAAVHPPDPDEFAWTRPKSVLGLLPVALPCRTLGAQQNSSFSSSARTSNSPTWLLSPRTLLPSILLQTLWLRAQRLCASPSPPSKLPFSLLHAPLIFGRRLPWAPALDQPTGASRAPFWPHGGKQSCLGHGGGIGSRGKAETQWDQVKTGGQERFGCPQRRQKPLASLEHVARRRKVRCRQRANPRERRRPEAITKALAEDVQKPAAAVRPSPRCHRRCVPNVPGDR